MRFTTLSLTFFAAIAAAQNSTLPDLVSQLPPCAASCLSSSAQDVGCATTDFTCLCGDKRQDFINSIGPCILFQSSCSGDEQSDLTTLAPEICNAATSNPDPSAVASASNIITSAVATATPSATPDAAARPEIGMGLLGAAALAAFAF
ncbi:hypothetical protein F4818DRAFT_433789 [Hypoxylon cercidicola]|nr:hypothetical protein F4818DRAFT_433789 [Hypoxylon cercidicola]